MREPEEEVDELARRVIGGAIEVHRTLGPGFREALYEEALAIEVGLRGIGFVRQALVEVSYKGAQIGSGRFDFLVGGAIGRGAEVGGGAPSASSCAGGVLPPGY